MINSFSVPYIVKGDLPERENKVVKNITSTKDMYIDQDNNNS